MTLITRWPVPYKKCRCFSQIASRLTTKPAAGRLALCEIPYMYIALGNSLSKISSITNAINLNISKLFHKLIIYNITNTYDTKSPIINY